MQEKLKYNVTVNTAMIMDYIYSMTITPISSTDNRVALTLPSPLPTVACT